MLLLPSLLLATLALAPETTACARHENHQRMETKKRQVVSQETPIVKNKDWAYEFSFNWGRLNPNYTLCQTGTQQSPIALSLSNGLSLNHRLSFNYSNITIGNFYNWGYGPAFTVSHPDGAWDQNPSFSYDDDDDNGGQPQRVTVYLKGWHVHSPADHTVGGDRSKSELHLVHVDGSTGRDKAVLAVRMDPSGCSTNDTFFAQLPTPFIGFNDTESTQQEVALDMRRALESVHHFDEFWTYRGSLTSPPCEEGIRWFVSRQVMFLGVGQMREVLGASTYSARAEQEVWLHRINE